ncbi:MAG TPA: hypothetical protein VHP32_11575 [Ignavibacteria bacterium]|nr:hypothetical protein [Ignavibacteria bacterium]
MKIQNYLQLCLIFTFITTFIFLSGCNNDPITSNMSDDEYVQSLAVNGGYSSDNDDDDNLMSSEVLDFDASGPVEDDGGSPFDSLVKWGRRVISVTVTTNFIINTDTLKKLEVIREISGNFVIVGYLGGSLDSVSKPYTQVQRRFLSFKRVGRSDNVRLNWRLYEYSAIDGQTTAPQLGKSNITISKIEFFKNDNLLFTLNGPDFTENVFRAKRFFGQNGILNFVRNDELKCRVTLNSNQSDTDYVAFHWSRNTFGYHRVSFNMVSQVPNGGTFDRVYEKNFRIYTSHIHGVFNAYLSANTRSSLWSPDVNLFSSTYAGLSYRVKP